MMLQRVIRSVFIGTHKRMPGSLFDRQKSLLSSLSIPEYHKLADNALDSLADTLSLLEEDLSDDDVDVNYSAPNQQIWWSSPISGPRRYEHMRIKSIGLSKDEDDTPAAWLWTGKMNELTDGSLANTPENAVIIDKFNLYNNLSEEILQATGVDITSL